MKLVIDTNIVISALIKDSKSREMITSGKLELVSPDFVLSEIRKYESHICTKSGLLNEEFEVLMALIFQKITIHKENKVILKLNVEKCYFSQRTASERLRIAKQILLAPIPIKGGLNAKSSRSRQNKD
ncbi:hypothetical protein HYU18_03015 [Candidatus Woesearchaeota archaeon]|nr:hypothetical protein [Candidatus Woesearchaeota archaeon]